MNDNDTLADDLRKDSVALMALLEAEKRKNKKLEAALLDMIKEFASSGGEQMTTAQRDALRNSKALTPAETKGDENV